MRLSNDLILLFLSILQFYSIDAVKTNLVTCGSVVKLLNVDYKTRMHSHDVKYGTGSGQQSVTAVETSDDVNSHWVIKGTTDKMCKRGSEIKCGETIRLQHLSTKKNLHSHHFTSPLSGNQEVSAYGDENGVGDTGDHWVVMCNSDAWERSTRVQFRHEDTRQFLAISGRTFGRPISGQMEVCAVNSGSSSGTEWQTAEGIFLHPTEPTHDNTIHTEL